MSTTLQAQGRVGFAEILLAPVAFPNGHWTRSNSINILELAGKEVNRRAKAYGVIRTLRGVSEAALLQG